MTDLESLTYEDAQVGDLWVYGNSVGLVVQWALSHRSPPRYISMLTINDRVYISDSYAYAMHAQRVVKV